MEDSRHFQCQDYIPIKHMARLQALNPAKKLVRCFRRKGNIYIYTLYIPDAKKNACYLCI